MTRPPRVNSPPWLTRFTQPGKQAGGTKKAPAAAPRIGKAAGKASAVTDKSKKVVNKRNPLFKSRPKVFGIGGDLRPKGSRNMYRFVRWPRYIKLQRQKQVLLARIKVPPAINQFRTTLEKNHSAELFRLLAKYKPESKQAKAARLLEEAKVSRDGGGHHDTRADSGYFFFLPQARAAGKPVQKSKPVRLHYGLNSVTGLVEQNEARLVVIAHDVDPIELVVWLPALCAKKNVPYVIVKGKSRLGQAVGMKTCAVLCLTAVHGTNFFSPLFRVLTRLRA